MSDLRDQPAIDAAKAADDAVFLEYHGQSPWALAKVKAGLRLNPQAVDYMRRENEARAEAKARFDKENAAFEAQKRKDAGLDPVGTEPTPAPPPGVDDDFAPH